MHQFFGIFIQFVSQSEVDVSQNHDFRQKETEINFFDKSESFGWIAAGTYEFHVKCLDRQMSLSLFLG